VAIPLKLNPAADLRAAPRDAGTALLWRGSMALTEIAANGATYLGNADLVVLLERRFEFREETDVQ
jgi:hypothetical protein